MPARNVPLATNQVYHIFNRGNALVPIFRNTRDYHQFINIFSYYQHAEPPIRYSYLNLLNSDQKSTVLNKISSKKDLIVEVIAFCFMPNHFHFLVKQKKDHGVMNFIRLTTNSYSHYFNKKYKRKGTLFEDRFKAVMIDSDDQLLHVTRYIHLNPFTSFVVKTINALFDYPFSSFQEYLGNAKNSICHKDLVLSQFSDLISYKDFVLNQADYQQKLELIRHKILEK